MTMKCPACGKDNAQGIKFCKKCGAYLAWSPTAAEAASDFQPTIMVPDSVDPESDATVIRPVARPTARHAPDTVPTQADPLLEALAGQPGPGPSLDRSDTHEAPSQTHAPDAPKGAGKTAVIVGGLVLLLALGAGAAYWWLGQESASARVRPVAAAPAPQPMAAPTPPPQMAPPPAAPEPVPAPVQSPLPAPVPEPAAAPAPAPAPASEPAAAPPAPPLPTASTARAKPRPKPVPKPAPALAAPRPAAPAPEPAPAPTQAPVAPEPPPAPAGPSSPAQACEGKSFFGKPACMNEQCAIPKFANHAQCVELREQNRRREEQQQRN
jgi:hypothetical protein